MSGSRCPVCGSQWSVGSRLFAPGDQCACEQRNTPVDLALEIGCSADWIGEGYLLLKEIFGKAGQVEVTYDNAVKVPDMTLVPRKRPGWLRRLFG
jgi:hypothetical protein